MQVRREREKSLRTLARKEIFLFRRSLTQVRRTGDDLWIRSDGDPVPSRTASDRNVHPLARRRRGRRTVDDELQPEHREVDRVAVVRTLDERRGRATQQVSVERLGFLVAFRRPLFSVSPERLTIRKSPGVADARPKNGWL